MAAVWVVACLYAALPWATTLHHHEGNTVPCSECIACSTPAVHIQTDVRPVPIRTTEDVVIADADILTPDVVLHTISVRAPPGT